MESTPLPRLKLLRNLGHQNCTWFGKSRILYGTALDHLLSEILLTPATQMFPIRALKCLSSFCDKTIILRRKWMKKNVLIKEVKIFRSLQKILIIDYFYSSFAWKNKYQWIVFASQWKHSFFNDRKKLYLYLFSHEMKLIFIDNQFL